MKVMFVENRQQTQFWEAVAARLQQDGHEISWMVQNAGFLSAVGQTCLIPYPNGNGGHFSIALDAELQEILSSDRNVNYFHGNSSHYAFYDAEIESTLNALKPHVVFGEATLFHELMCIRHCRKRGIPYLNPTSCRYPPGRFSFYLYDTQRPVHGSGQVFDATLCQQIANSIARRELEPDYMRREAKAGILYQKFRAARNALRITASYLSGEHYNTPSPATKLLLGVGLRRNRRRWEGLAAGPVATTGKFRLLYPLQMQPESTIDVWGNKYMDQVQLLRDLLRATDNETTILVKPNPKSKYELSDDLVHLVASSHRFHPVSHAVTMGGVMRMTDLVVTVTGTVAIEAIFSDLPTVTLIKSLNNTIPQCMYLEDLDDLSNVISQVREETFPRATDAQKTEFLNLLTRTSYQGIISNPYSTPSCMSEQNIRAVHRAFRHVLMGVAETPAAEVE